MFFGGAREDRVGVNIPRAHFGGYRLPLLGDAYTYMDRFSLVWRGRGRVAPVSCGQSGREGREREVWIDGRGQFGPFMLTFDGEFA